MNTEQLPTEELKKFGIINEDLSFSKKLNANDIQKFLQGYTIVADNDRNRATFQLTDNNTQLKVIFLERDKSIADILKNSKEQIQYTELQFAEFGRKDKRAINEERPNFFYGKKALVYDEESGKVAEFDLVKNATELTAIIADKKDILEIKRYKNELLKLKSFLQDKIDQFPEIAKEIATDLNIVSKEINTVDGISESLSKKQQKTNIDLKVNNPDLYQDANRMREEQEEEQEETQKSKGFRR